MTSKDYLSLCNIAHTLSGKTFACVAGATQHEILKDFFPQLKHLGVEMVVDAYDMDQYTNPDVARGVEKMLALAKECGFMTDRLRWDSKYKGIDDFLLAKRGSTLTTI